ncbi:hypothetical protein DFH09DRAFT_1315994 [Mycena vulgaris]|nr:hypothetical protein DFH09DRAFT_1324527 [Mycena vulgaris]KAJ6561412.1 hypothetical protein DFH09DRAFT_1315994 [Mycena vulgaris]
MPAPFSLIRTFIVSIWVEGVIYGFFICIFSLSLAVNLGTSKSQSAHSRAMFIVGIITFILATVHISINCMRMMRGYVDHSALPGGPVGYLGILSQWDHIFKDVIYATQSIVGDSVAVYRCWVLWNRNFYVVCIPFFMVFGSAVSGYMACAIFAKIQAGSTVFAGSLDAWIKTFASLAVAQNIITTALMAWRIAAAEQQVSSYRIGKGNLMPILRILVESAALYLVAELILLILYASNTNAQFIALEAITPIVGITFNLITIRITLRSQSSSSESGSGSQGTDSRHPTIGHIPLRHIAVNITNSKVTDDDVESQSGGEDVNEVRKISGE